MGSATGAEAPVRLHGDLEVWIMEARRLPNMDITSERMRSCFTACVSGEGGSRSGGSTGGRSKKKKKRLITSASYAYVSVCLAGATVAQTRVIPNSGAPRWDERFRVEVAHAAATLDLHVKDNHVFGARLIGVASVPARRLAAGSLVHGWFPIIHHGHHHHHHHHSPAAELRFSLRYTPAQLQHDSSPLCAAVPNAYFPLRRGGRVTLYQDAHVADGQLPDIELDGGATYTHGRCWEDISRAVVDAHHLVYVVGWSIHHPIRLVREPAAGAGTGTAMKTLGELLKGKVHEGVRVVMLIWDDKTSHDRFLLKTDGVMHTHDEESRKFFRHSGVHCVLVPRYGSNKLSIFKQHVVGTLFTHHQKCVIVDSQAAGNNRNITAFLGGLDLCDGRYDTPEHRLFNDLDTVFHKDFHNPTFPVNSYGPRQPWHDLHCKVEGPAAYDILTNFEQRWRKATKWRVNLKKVVIWHYDTLIKIKRMPWIVSPSTDEANARVCHEQDTENWHVQVFRSIDSGSVKGFPKLVQEAQSQNLVCAKNLKIDRSIHSAYVKAIRSAQHFIYIENQYFIGSSFCWHSHKNTDNLIPVELALKIASKIKAKQRFAVYIVIPMWPEGIPTTAAVQQILFWQGQTMSMMYKIIADALESQGLVDSHPQEYLNFYCLGRRELAATPEASLCNDNSALGMAQKHRRFMIYVHSKGMLVDDEYVVIGSANINQRSMEGSRDTEIAMGAYQPHHTSAGNRGGPPRGQVYGYRMSLWAEHLGGRAEEWFRRPESEECVRRVNAAAEENWRAYVSPDEATRGHLMRYPVKVDRDGGIGPLPGHECFPDVGGKVLGAQSSLPDALTT
uniref:Phospholipase D n=2 Tax=Aegilops tauschii subsp. strangulata TaxID=200361 RepID=A0A453MFP0_AEGTS